MSVTLTLRRTYLLVARLMPLAVLGQVGLAVFGIPLAGHAVLGGIVGAMAILLVWLVRAINPPSSQHSLAFGLLALVGLQPFFIALSPRFPALAALHAINGFVILGVALALALDSEGGGNSSRSQSEIRSLRQ